MRSVGVSHEVPFKKESVHQFGADAQGYSMIPPAAEPLLDDWQNNLAMLAANRTPTAMEIANKLGDRLLNERNNVSTTLQFLNSTSFEINLIFCVKPVRVNFMSIQQSLYSCLYLQVNLVARLLENCHTCLLLKTSVLLARS